MEDEEFKGPSLKESLPALNPTNAEYYCIEDYEQERVQVTPNCSHVKCKSRKQAIVQRTISEHHNDSNVQDFTSKMSSRRKDKHKTFMNYGNTDNIEDVFERFKEIDPIMISEEEYEIESKGTESKSQINCVPDYSNTPSKYKESIELGDVSEEEDIDTSVDSSRSQSSNYNSINQHNNTYTNESEDDESMSAPFYGTSSDAFSSDSNETESEILTNELSTTASYYSSPSSSSASNSHQSLQGNENNYSCPSSESSDENRNSSDYGKTKVLTKKRQQQSNTEDDSDDDNDNEDFPVLQKKSQINKRKCMRQSSEEQEDNDVDYRRKKKKLKRRNSISSDGGNKEKYKIKSRVSKRKFTTDNSNGELKSDNGMKRKKVENESSMEPSLADMFKLFQKQQKDLEKKSKMQEKEILKLKKDLQVSKEKERKGKTSDAIYLRKVNNDAKKIRDKDKKPAYKENFKATPKPILDPRKLKKRGKSLTVEEAEAAHLVLRTEAIRACSSSIFSHDYEKDLAYYKKALAFHKAHSYRDIDISQIAQGGILLNLRNIARPVPLLAMMKPTIRGRLEKTARKHGFYFFLYAPICESNTLHRIIALLGVVGGALRVMYLVHLTTTLTFAAMMASIMKCLTQRIMEVFGDRKNMLPEFSGEICGVDSSVDPLEIRTQFRTYTNAEDPIQTVCCRMSSGLPKMLPNIAAPLIKEKNKLVEEALKSEKVQHMITCQTERLHGAPIPLFGQQILRILQCLFPEIFDYQVHRETCNERLHQNYRCEICDEILDNFVLFEKHMATFHPPIFPCPDEECEKVFKSKASLDNHSSVHTGIYKLKCDTCKFRCNYPSVLHDHELRHKEEKLFVCDVADCLQAFKTRLNMLNHRRQHEFKTLLTCSGCNFTTFYPTKLKAHINSNICKDYGRKLKNQKVKKQKVKKQKDPNVVLQKEQKKKEKNQLEADLKSARRDELEKSIREREIQQDDIKWKLLQDSKNKQ